MASKNIVKNRGNVKVKASIYMKNVGRSLARASGDVFSQYMPTVASVGRTSAQAARTAKDGIKKIKEGNISASVKDFLNADESILTNLLDDLKTGNWYNTEREDNLFDFDMDYEDEDWGDDEESSSTTDQMIAHNDNNSKQIINSMGNMSTSISKSFGKVSAKSAEYIVSNVTAGQRALYDLNKTGFNQITGVLLNMNNSIDTLVKLGEPMLIHMKESSQFYAQTSNTLNEINENLGKIVKRTEFMEVGPGGKSKDTNFFGKIMFGKDFDMEEYMEMVKENFKASTSMFSMLGSIGKTMAGKYGKNISPMQYITTGLIEKMIPKVIKESTEAFNESLGNAIVTGMARGRRAANKKGGIASLLASIFLPPEENMKYNKSNYNKGNISWDGIARKSLVEVIPTYLAKIYAALGGEEKYYNFEKGKFESLDIMRKARELEEKAYANKSAGDFRTYVARNVDSSYRGSDAEQLKKEIDNFYLMAFRTGLDFYEIEDRLNDKKFLEGMGISKRAANMIAYSIKTARQSASRGERSLYSNFQANVYRERGNYAQNMRNREANGYSNDMYFDSGFENATRFSTGNNRGNRRRGTRSTGGERSNFNAGRRVVFNGKSEDQLTDAEWRAWQAGLTKDEYEKLSEKQKDREQASLDSRIRGQRLSEDDETTSWIKDFFKKQKEKFGQTRIGSAMSRFKSIIDAKMKDENSIFYGPAITISNFIDKLTSGINDLFWGSDGVLKKLKTGFKDLFDKLKEKIWESDPVKRMRYAIKGTWEDTKDEFNSIRDKVTHKMDEWRHSSGNLDDDTYNRNEAIRADNEKNRYYKTKAGKKERAQKEDYTHYHGKNIIYNAGPYIPNEFLNPYGQLALPGETEDGKKVGQGSGLLRRFSGGDSGTENNNKKNSVAGSMIKDGATTLYSGIKEFMNRTLLGDNPKKEKEKVMDSISETLGKMKEYRGAMGVGAIAGAGVSLLTGAVVGPLAGAAIGAGVGFLAKSGKLGNWLFGEVDEKGNRKGGIISKETQDKVSDFIKGHIPNITAGAIAGLVAGPFGIAGNLIMGSAVGYLSTTNKFKDIILGKEGRDGKRKGGLAGSLHDKIIAPIDDIIHNIGNGIFGFMRKLGTNISNMMKSLNKKLLEFGKKKIEKAKDGRGLFGAAYRGVSKVGKEIYNATSGALFKTSGALKKYNLNRGNGVYDNRAGRNLTAQERIGLRNVIANGGVMEEDGKYYSVDMHGRRKLISEEKFDQLYKKNATGGLYKGNNKFTKLDKYIAGLSPEQLEELANADDSALREALNSGDLEGNWGKKGISRADLAQARSLLKSESNIKNKVKKDDEEEAKNNPVFRKVKGIEELLRKHFGIPDDQSEKISSETDFLGNVHLYTENNQGEKIEVTNDKETTKSREAINKFTKSIEGIPLIGKAMDGVNGFLGKLKEKLFGDDEKKEGWFSKIFKGLFGDGGLIKGLVGQGGILGAILNFFKNGGLITVLGAALAGLSLGGHFDNLFDRISQLEIFKGNDTNSHGTIADSTGYDATDKNGNNVHFDSLEDLQEAVKSGKVLANSIKASGRDTSWSTQLKKNLVRGALFHGTPFGGSVVGRAFGIKKNTQIIKGAKNIAGNVAKAGKTTASTLGKVGKATANTAKKAGSGIKGIISKFTSKGSSAVERFSGDILDASGNVILEQADDVANSVGKNAIALIEQNIDDAVPLIAEHVDDTAKAIPILRKILGDKTYKIITSLAQKIKDFITKKVSALKATIVVGSEAFEEALIIIKIAYVALRGIEGWYNASSTLGIVDQPTTSQKTISMLIAVINSIIPYIGDLIPDNVFVNMIVEVCKMFNLDDEQGSISKLIDQRDKANEIVSKYNEETGRNLSIRDYNIEHGNSGFWTMTGYKIKQGYAKFKATGGIKGVGERAKEGISNAGKSVVDWTKNLGTNIKNGVGGFVNKASESIKNLGSKIGSLFNFDKLLSLAKAGEVVELFMYDDGSKTDTNDETGGFSTFVSKIPTFLTKVTLMPIALQNAISNYFKNEITSRVSDIKELSKAVAYAEKSGEEIINDRKSLSEFLNTDNIGISENNHFKGIGKAAVFGARILSAPVMIVKRIGKSISEKFTQIWGDIKETGSNLSTNTRELFDLVSKGEAIEFFAHQIPNKDSDNPFNWLVSASSYIQKFTLAGPAVLSAVGHQTVEGVKTIWEEVKNAGIGGKNAIKDMLDLTAKGEFIELMAYNPASESTSNGMAVLMNTLALAPKWALAPFGLLSAVGHGVYDFFKNIHDKVTNESYQADREQNNVELLESVTNGDIKGLWAHEPVISEDNPLAGFISGSNKALKLVYTVPTILSAGAHNIRDFFKTFGEEVSNDAQKVPKSMEALKKYAEDGQIMDIWLYDPQWNKTGISGLFDVAVGFGRIFYTIAAALKKLVDPIKEFAEEYIINPGKELGSDIYDGVQNFKENVKNKAEEGWDKFTNWVTGHNPSTGGHKFGDSGGSSFVSQYDPRYQNYKIHGNTFADKGCGPAVAAMATGMPVSRAMSSSRDYQNSNGVSMDYFADVMASKGMRPRLISGGSSQDLYSNIAKGKKTVLLGRDPSNTSKAFSPFGPGNHYVLATGVDRRGNVIVNDPELGGPRAYNPSILNSVSYGMSGGGSAADWNLGSWSPVTADQLNQYIASVRPDSPFNGRGDAFVKAGEESGLDPRYILAHAAIESSWGTHRFGTDRHNYFGIGAYDSNPGNAWTFADGTEDGLLGGIVEGAKWISRNYYNGREKQTTLNRMRYSDSGTHDYCTSTTWPNSIGSIMQKISDKFAPNTKVTEDESVIEHQNVSNLSDRGYNSSTAGYTQGYKNITTNNSNGKNLSDRGYNSSTAGYTQGYKNGPSSSSGVSGFSNSGSVSTGTKDSKKSNIKGMLSGIISAFTNAFGKLFNGTDNESDESTADNLTSENRTQEKSQDYQSSGGALKGTSVLSEGPAAKGDIVNNFPYFNQGEEPWASIQYGKNKVKDSGCGPTSMAMVLRSYGVEADPAKTVEYSLNNGYRTKDKGTAWGFFNSIGSTSGLTTNEFTDKETAIQALNNNIPVIASMKPGDFTKGGHFIVLSGIDGDKLYVNDPASRQRSGNVWNVDGALSQAKRFWAISKDGQGSINSDYVLNLVDPNRKSIRNQGGPSSMDGMNYSTGITNIKSREVKEKSAAGSRLLSFNDYATLAKVSGGSSGLLIGARPGSRNNYVVNPRNGKLVPLKNISGGDGMFDSISTLASNVQQRISTNVKKLNNEELLLNIAQCVIDISNNTKYNAKIEDIVNILKSYLSTRPSGGDSGLESNDVKVIKKSNNTKEQASIFEEDREVDNHIRALAGVLAELAKG